MTAEIASLDAHEQPSDELRAKWKAYSKQEAADFLSRHDIDDLRIPEKAAEFVVAGQIPAEQLKTSFNHLSPSVTSSLELDDAPIYYHPLLPGQSRALQSVFNNLGLLIVPSVIPPQLQKILLDRIIHRDLSNPRHQTSLHLHWKIPYPGLNDEQDHPTRSFFSYPPDSVVNFEPKDPAVHKPLSIKQVLERKLHWVTLGGQYDWTNRVYPGEEPPQFPPDISSFLEALFPETLAQAAIVNFYTPGDTMMMHRDVSEETDKGLVSISIGCDSLFMIAPNDVGKMSEEEKRALPGGKDHLILRLRSGDAVYMTNESRFAWHGVPKVLKGTCPSYLEDWPAGEDDGRFEGWKGWMRNKRININVRQMRD